MPNFLWLRVLGLFFDFSQLMTLTLCLSIPGIGVKWHQYIKPRRFLQTAGTSNCGVGCHVFTLLWEVSSQNTNAHGLLLKWKSFGSKHFLTCNNINQVAGQSLWKKESCSLMEGIMVTDLLRKHWPHCREGCCSFKECSHCVLMKWGRKRKGLNFCLNPI